MMRPERELRLLGIDIGGTQSRARLWAGGRIAAQARAPSASLPAAGPEGAKAALTALLAGVGVDRAQPLDAICVGSAGLSVTGADEFLREQLAPATRSGAVVIVSDVMLVLPAAGLDAGIAVICGTGSVAVGSFGDRTVQVGGWGYLLGDGGGGYWIVREALRVLLARRDQARPAGDLGAALLSATGSDDLATLHRRYYEQPHFPSAWARHATLVLDSPDPAAAIIAARAGQAVAGLAWEAASKLDPPMDLPVVLAGGLLGNAAFRRAACDAIALALPAAVVTVLDDEPVAGAVRLARQAATRGVTAATRGVSPAA
jgi:N-acetylglucosamine kinase-like BadF-type ATPase